MRGVYWSTANSVIFHGLFRGLSHLLPLIWYVSTVSFELFVVSTGREQHEHNFLLGERGYYNAVDWVQSSFLSGGGPMMAYGGPRPLLRWLHVSPVLRSHKESNFSRWSAPQEGLLKVIHGTRVGLVRTSLAGIDTLGLALAGNSLSHPLHRQQTKTCWSSFRSKITGSEARLRGIRKDD